MLVHKNINHLLCLSLMIGIMTAAAILSLGIECHIY